LYVAREMGIDVPTQLSVAGYDDTPLSRHIYPSLTTVRQPIREMGYAAVQCLLAAMRGRGGFAEKDAISRRFACELVVRDSVGPGPA
jgi:LacI family transcriptional regulator, galactose operon repressor